ncbi:hypothetical protein JVT61DRAFT_11252 [Boletus reticuloceps]|uniref:Uncharacterized protein n=1 Tax=Boletus reticuloceps TaxID=495285 RepID=A0A8I3A4R5_9AGAM|nr:hypothetical protein JVT61DRAFT_11252 [Boletus reticuloceps]
MDVPDVALVIQWRAMCNLSALWQRFGRAARNRELTGTALLFAEREHFDDEREAKAARKAQWLRTRKRKANDAHAPGTLRPAKRQELLAAQVPRLFPMCQWWQMVHRMRGLMMAAHYL